MKAIVKKTIKRPDPEWLVKFGDIPATIVSDCLNRYYAMNGEIKPIFENIKLCGIAVTIQSIPGNNMMSHLALTFAQPGDVLVIDARGCVSNAVWGEIQGICALKKGVAGIVVDGAIRDVAAMREARFPVYCRSVTPAGPHKGWADSINVPIQCGGIPVIPGDLVLGDDDGVVVVPQELIEKVYCEAQRRLKLEQEWVRRVEEGEDSLDVVGLREALEKMEIEYRT